MAPLRRLHEIDVSQRVVLLIDGLDEAAGRAYTTILEVIPRPDQIGFPPNLQLVMTSRPGGDHLVRFPADDILRLDKVTGITETRRDARTYIESRLGEEPLRSALQAMTHDQSGSFVEELDNASQGNFLYLRHFFAEARNQIARGEGLGTPPVPKGLNDIYRFFAVEKIKRQVTLRDRTGVHLPILGVLAIAFEAVESKLLARLSGVDQGSVDFFLDEVTAFLDVEEHQDGNRYRLCHSLFAEYLLDPSRNRDWPLDARRLHTVI